MNHSDTDDTEIVSGDEGDLTPIHDITVETDNDGVVETVVEPVAIDSLPAEELDQSDIIEPQPAVDMVSDWHETIVEEPLVPVETFSEVAQSAKVKSRPGAWQQARNFFFGGSADVSGRLNNLTQAIEDAPESAVNYVLRADLYMALREYALAQADFQRAIELAETQFELSDWGLLDQVLRDRAISGLEKVKRRLR